MTAILPLEREPIDTEVRVPGVHIGCDQVGFTSRDGERLLDSISLEIRPGELVAIVGPSGAGKSTLLGVLAGLMEATSGRVTMCHLGGAGVDVARGDVAFVPQDDVIHRELPLHRVLRHAARLRLAAHSRRSEVDRAVADALRAVDLEPYGERRVGDLSGGQRRRASIALELVTHPKVCFLDEPTSGLDQVAAASVVGRLRALADAGSTVVFVTHNESDLEHCDRVIELAEGGRLVAAHRTTRVSEHPATGVSEHRATGVPIEATDAADPARRRRSGWLRQWAALTARSLEVMFRNRLTLAILVGSPAMVIAMFAVLFQPGAFEPGTESPTAIVMIVFWVAFGGFFFGLTYGLLQICPELPIIRRERTRGVSVGAQVLAKLAALTPVLLLIVVVMLAVLRLLDRLPAADGGTYARVAVTLALDAVAALALGLLASSAVSTPAQAALALPMLCFPAVLFSGAIVPVPVMAPVGRFISAAMTDRWAFEAIGRDLGVRDAFESSPLGAPLLTQYGDTWTRPTVAIWVVLAAAAVGLLAVTWVVLQRRCSGAIR